MHGVSFGFWEAAFKQGVGGVWWWRRVVLPVARAFSMLGLCDMVGNVGIELLEPM